MNDMIDVRFPSLNKRSNLIENDGAIAESNKVHRCRVMKRLKVHNAVYNAMGNELLSDINDSLYESIGGSRSDDPRLEGIDNFFTILNNPELKEIFMSTSYMMVVEVMNIDTGAAFYVNTEGHKYARFVGRAMGPA